MKLTGFITTTNPEQRGDTYGQCLEAAQNFCDDVVVVNGKDTWTQEFSWPVIGEHFQRGYEEATGDWVIHLDTDFIIHEEDYGAIRKACESEAPALSMWKYQFIRPDRYNLKSRLVLLVNKGEYGDRIRFDSGGDLCQPSLDGDYIKPYEVPEARIPFYNYEKPTKTVRQIKDDVGRMDRAYFTHFGEYLYGQGDDDSAYEGWMKMATGRAARAVDVLSLDDHPKVMQETLSALRPSQFGYDGFGAFERCPYVKGT